MFFSYDWIFCDTLKTMTWGGGGKYDNNCRENANLEELNVL